MLPDSVILGNCAILWVYCEFIGVFFIVENFNLKSLELGKNVEEV